jgi:hypothetical protein
MSGAPNLLFPRDLSNRNIVHFSFGWYVFYLFHPPDMIAGTLLDVEKTHTGK